MGQVPRVSRCRGNKVTQSTEVYWCFRPQDVARFGADSTLSGLIVRRRGSAFGLRADPKPLAP